MEERGKGADSCPRNDATDLHRMLLNYLNSFRRQEQVYLRNKENGS